VEHERRRNEAQLADTGSLDALTGERTARSPQDRYIVRDSSIDAEIDWGKVNRPLSPAAFDRLLNQARQYANQRELFVQDAAAGADLRHRLTRRVVAEQAWPSLFARCLFLSPTSAEVAQSAPEWLVLAVPSLRLAPAKEGLHSPAAIAISFERKTILIAG